MTSSRGELVTGSCTEHTGPTSQSTMCFSNKSGIQEYSKYTDVKFAQVCFIVFPLFRTCSGTTLDTVDNRI